MSAAGLSDIVSLAHRRTWLARQTKEQDWERWMASTLERHQQFIRARFPEQNQDVVADSTTDAFLRTCEKVLSTQDSVGFEAYLWVSARRAIFDRLRVGNRPTMIFLDTIEAISDRPSASVDPSFCGIVVDSVVAAASPILSDESVPAIRRLLLHGRAEVSQSEVAAIAQAFRASRRVDSDSKATDARETVVQVFSIGGFDDEEIASAFGLAKSSIAQFRKRSASRFRSLHLA